MFNIFKKKPNEIEFLNPIPGIAATYPIYEAKNFKREWVEKSAKDAAIKKEESDKTCPVSHFFNAALELGYIAKCPGIRNYMNTGYILPSPFDFVVKTNGDGESFEANTLAPRNISYEPVHIGVFHFTKELYHNYNPVLPGSLKTVLKIATGWHVVPSKDYVFMLAPVMYSNETRFAAAFGIFDPYVTSSLNVNMFWFTLNGKVVIKAGTPLMQIIPIPRDFIQPKVKNSFVENKDMHYIHAAWSKISLSYTKDYKKIAEAGKRLWSTWGKSKN